MRSSVFLTSWRFYLGAIAASLLCPFGAQAVPEIILTPTGTAGTGPFYLAPNTANQTINIYVSGGGTVVSPPSGPGAGTGANTDTVSGVDFEVTIQDGATGYGLSGNPTNHGTNNTGTGPGAVPANGPAITSVDIFPANSLFNPTGVDGTTTGTSGPTVGNTGTNQFYVVSTALSANGGPSGNGFTTITTSPQLLATVTLSTVGVLGTTSSPVLYSISVKGTYENGAGVDTAPTDFVNVDANGTWDSTPNANYLDGTLVVPEPASLGLLGLAIPALLLRRRTRHV